MIQDSGIIKNKHKRFVKTICQTETLFALKNSKGFATSYSVHYEDDNEDPVSIICFWAEESLAKSCISKNWSDYKLFPISLVEFVESWCIGMESDGLIVGTEFDQNMFGYEAFPFDLIIEIIEELKSINKNLTFKKFDSLSDLENQVREFID